MSSARRTLAAAITLTGLTLTAASASAQSLFVRRDPHAPAAEQSTPASPTLRAASLIYVEPPKPPTYKLHDLVTNIIDESSNQTSKQTLDTKKDYELKNTIQAFVDLQRALEGDLAQGVTTPNTLVGLNSHNKLKGEGTYSRTDSFKAKVTAEIIDIKPNGVLVLEARKTRKTDDESQTMVLCGSCRQADVTSSNTVLSSQLADLNIRTDNEGDVKDAASKGFIPRIIEAIFNF